MEVELCATRTSAGILRGAISVEKYHAGKTVHIYPA